MAPTRTARLPALSIVRRIRDVECPTSCQARDARSSAQHLAFPDLELLVRAGSDVGGAASPLFHQSPPTRLGEAGKADAVWFLWTGGAEGAREVLSAIASSTIRDRRRHLLDPGGGAGAGPPRSSDRASCAASRDTGNQIALGTFIATFLYCVLVLRTVSGANAVSSCPTSPSRSVSCSASAASRC